MLKSIVAALLASAVATVAIPSLAPAPALAAEAAAKADAQQGVPVAQVVLFSSGVGYFEHFGSVDGDVHTELRFKTSQINDILKSLIVQDLDGGKILNIIYPSQDPIARALRAFQVDITGNPPLADLLNQLRGAKVTVSYKGEKLEGTILGVEAKLREVAEKKVVEENVLNLLNGAMIRSLNLGDVSDLSLDDAQLQEELAKALAALSQARDQDKKPVLIHFAGEGARRVKIGYVVETPIWKTSYRLVLGEQPKLQGWAIVENQTDNDWNDVALTLVSGRPISFIQDLYQPLYVARPVVVPELFAGLTPRTYDAGLGGAGEAEQDKFGKEKQSARRALRENSEGMLRDDPAAAPAPGAADAAYMEEGRALDPTASVASLASAAKVGELFKYTVGNVSLPRQKSAMIPIIVNDIEVEKLSIYNPAVLPRNPLYGARVKNTTGNHLLQGPATVLEDGGYAGDARIDDVPPGQERYLSYGVDLEMLVNVANVGQSNQVQTGKIVKGVLYLKRMLAANTDYAVENKSDRDKKLVIEHAFRPGWKLVAPAKADETTQTLYRFKDTVEKGKQSKLTVREEFVQDEAIAILPTDPGTLNYYANTGEIPQNVREALAKAKLLKQAQLETQRQIQQHQQRIVEIRNDQRSYVENMKVLDKATPTYNNYLKRMGEQETEIEKLERQIKDQQAVAQDQQRDLENFLNELNVE